MAKIIDRPDGEKVIKVKTKTKSQNTSQAYKWWEANSKKELAQQALDTVGFLKERQQERYRKAGIYARMYGNMPLLNLFGANFASIQGKNYLPVDRPTMNVVQSCVDTLVSRITQAKPSPRFLTDAGDYRERKLAKQLNQFVAGEFYQTKAYQVGEYVLRDAEVFGTGCVKVYETPDKKVGLERVLLTELLTDPNDALYGNPRQLFQLKLIDRSVLSSIFPEYKSDIAKAEQAFPDNSADAQKTAADQVMVAECWHLPSGPDSGDGRHVIVCTSGVILDEEWEKDKFPFVFLHYSNPVLGFWGQGLAEQLMGTQVEINKLLMTITKSINLVGVPRVFVEDGSRVVKAHLNNEIGAIVTYQGTKPEYEVAPCVPAELYAQLERLVQYSYQQSGVSALSAAAQKPAGLNSGEAIRNYDDLQSDRFAALVRRYDNYYIDLAYQITDKAIEIAKRDGKYETVYPNKNSSKTIDLPDLKELENPFVIQCFDTSSLPRDPAGRVQAIIERMQAGLISPDEGRRLLGDLDLEQYDKLANAAEERILQILDEIVEDGKYTPPDPFMLLPLAEERVTQYYNLYMSANLSEDRAQKLRDFFSQIQLLKGQAQAGAMAQAGAAPGAQASVPAQPQQPPVSDMMPIAG